MPDNKAKPSKAILALKEELKKGFIDTEVTVRGHVFKLRTLTEDDETWADSFVRSISPMSMINSRKAPRVAASIMSIDGTPASDLFEFSDSMPEEEKKQISSDAHSKRYWLYNQLLMFLMEDSNRHFITELYAAYEKMEQSAVDGIKEVSN